MNNAFSLRRIARYARKHYVENARSYLYCLLAFFLLQAAAAWVFNFFYADPVSYRTTTVFLMGGYLFVITRIACRGHRDPRQQPLVDTLPVTLGERYAFIWFHTAVAAMLGYRILLAMLPVQLSVVQPHGPVVSGELNLLAWLVLYLFQSVLLIASFWTKGNPLKATIPLLAAFVGFCGLYYFGLNSLYGFLVRVPFSEIGMVWNGDSASVVCRLPAMLTEKAALVVGFGFWIGVFWLAGYFKFRERTLQ